MTHKNLRVHSTKERAGGGGGGERERERERERQREREREREREKKEEEKEEKEEKTTRIYIYTHTHTHKTSLLFIDLFETLECQHLFKETKTKVNVFSAFLVHASCYT